MFLASGGHPELLAVLLEDLVGRAAECERVERLLESAGAGHADRVVLVGEAGIGKSALLAWGAARAREFRVAGAVGVESEQELAFAGLAALLRPLLDGLAELPGPQRAALEGALALGPPEPGAGFAVGAATLGLLAAAAERTPVLVVLDDAQWIDEPTRQTLAFALRRLDADRVGVLAASRPGGLGPLVGARFEALELGPLNREDALALALRAHRELAAPVAERLLDRAYGNPLALVELPRLLDAEQLSGAAPLPPELPVGANLARSFAGTATTLRAESQHALVAAAVLGGDDLIELGAALELLGLGADELTPAELAGLVHVEGTRFAFRHPLVRSAVLETATAADVRRAHAAVAESLPAGERRARHRAAACTAPDEAVAAELEAAALEARDRRAPAAAVSLLERAAELSPRAADAGARLFHAAEAAWIAGLKDAATAFAERALDRTADPPTRTDALHLLGQITHQTAPPRVAQAWLLEAAELAEASDPARAAPILTDLFTSYVYDGKPEQALTAARHLWALDRRDGLSEFLANHCLGVALIWNGLADEGNPHVYRALELVDVLHDEPRHLAIAGMDAAWVDDPELGAELSARAIEVARTTGAIAALPTLLKFAAWADFDSGRWSAAYATGSEAAALAAETGQTAQRCSCVQILLTIEGLTGREDAAYAHAQEVSALADELELPWHRAGFLHALGRLELGVGRLKRAIAIFEEMRELIERRGIRTAGQSGAPDHVEALVRLGDLEAARVRVAEFAELEGRAPPILALLRRCEGLVADDESFDEPFRTALDLHPADTEIFARARTQLCYGERLRRAGRRREARDQLEAALATFEALAAEPWAARAHAELVASGRRLRRRGPGERDELTPQELQVAVHVARGLSNREIAQALFLSPKTIESHLTRIYRKLDLHARGELIDRFADQV